MGNENVHCSCILPCCDAATPLQRHRFCSQTQDTWFKFQLDKIQATNNYKNRPGIHIKLKEKFKPVFMSLASDELLSKCLHGKTQNNNAFISNIIWNRYPKPFMLAKRRCPWG